MNSNARDIQVLSKKQWMKENFNHGLVFYRAAVRGKCFIEYIPAEYAWIPLVAPDVMHINCLLASGSMKGHGYANDLLEYCIKDSKKKGKRGISILSMEKKQSFLSDPKFLRHKGFSVVDKSDNGVQLWYYPLDDHPAPSFHSCAKHPQNLCCKGCCQPPYDVTPL